MKKLIALTLALMLALTLAACGGNGGTTPPASDTPTATPPQNDTSSPTPDNSGDSGTDGSTDNGDSGEPAPIIPDNGTPPNVPPPLESHAGDKGYFYVTTDDYIVWVEFIDPDDPRFSGFGGKVYARYHVASFDESGKPTSTFYKLLFTNEADAVTHYNNTTSGHNRALIDNIIYIDMTGADFIEWWDKSSCLSNASNYEHFISKP
ncbi:MAG: hypothetical protein FWD44_01485 [Oscillospiraceae bacterium]|nr:hypothetical protein [Oscillospiraceae bacterium]